MNFLFSSPRAKLRWRPKIGRKKLRLPTQEVSKICMAVCIKGEPRETTRFELANQQPTSSRLQDSTNHEGGGLQCIFCLPWTEEDSSSAEDQQRTWHSDIDKRFKNLNYLNGCAYRDSGIISTFEGEAPSSRTPFPPGKLGIALSLR